MTPGLYLVSLVLGIVGLLILILPGGRATWWLVGWLLILAAFLYQLIATTGTVVHW